MEQQPKEPRPVRFRHLVAMGIACALIGGAVTAYADFDDVGPSHPFYDEISWMEDTGISTGYDDGTYRPNDPVTRMAMSAFMARLYNLQAGLTAVDTGTDGGSTTAIDTWTTVTGASATVTIPPGTTGRVLALFTGEGYCNHGDNSIFFRPACELRLLLNGTQMSPGPLSFMDSDDAAITDQVADVDNIAVQGVSASTALAPGSYTVTAQMRANDADGNVDDELILDIAEFTLSTQVLLNDVAL